MRKVYLDYQATTPVDRIVVDTMLPYFCDEYGNPSSIHSSGQKAKAAIEDAREIVAFCLGAKSSEIVFTGSGTESNNLALKGIAFSRNEPNNHIIATGIEHYSVLETCRYLEQQGWQVTFLPVDSYGLVDPEDLKKAIKNKTALISIIHGNNEIGTIQPVADIGKIAKEKGICFHVDAVQSFGHVPINVDELNVDLLSISAHKLYGPKGIGALYIRKNTALTPLLHGGGQETGRRSSTHNVPGIIGLAKASELARDKMATETERITKLSDRLTSSILKNIENTKLNGHQKNRLSGNINISFDKIKSELLLLALDTKGIACSAGSACDAGSIEPSHVLRAIGLSKEIASSSIRFSIGRFTTENDIDYVLESLEDTVKRLRSKV